MLAPKRQSTLLERLVKIYSISLEKVATIYFNQAIDLDVTKKLKKLKKEEESLIKTISNKKYQNLTPAEVQEAKRKKVIYYYHKPHDCQEADVLHFVAVGRNPVSNNKTLVW